MRKNAFVLGWVLLLALPVWGLAQSQEPPKKDNKEPAKPASISGVWDLTVQTPQGDMPSEATFTQDKESIKVTMSGPQGSVSGEGTLKEGTIQWTLTISTSQGDFSIFFKGKVDADKMSGEVQMGDHGTANFSGSKRK